MRYHTHYRTFSLRFSWFWGNLQRVTMRYLEIYKKIYIYQFFKKIGGNALQIVLHYGQTMFVEFENFSYPKVASYMTNLSQISQVFRLAFFKLIK